MSLKLSGVLGPVVTPFDASGELDLDGFAANAAAHVAAGLDGIVIAGSTGEAALLDERERAQLVERGRDAVPPGKLVIAGAGAESTRTTVKFARAAAERGADAVLVVAPHYFGSAMTADALDAHYRRVADSSPVPVVLYNIPKYMHFALAPSLVHRLADHGNVIGIKDSSGDLSLISTYINSASNSFAVLTGSGTTFRQALAMGAKGGILAVSLFAPALTRGIHEAHLAGRGADADNAQARLAPLAARIVGELGVPGVKAALDALGLRGGAPRMPLLPLGDAGMAEVRELVRAIELASAHA